MSEIKGHDLGRYCRLVDVEAPRIRGTFMVLRGDKSYWVRTYGVVACSYKTRRAGRALHYLDLLAEVRQGVVIIERYWVAADKRAVIEPVWDEMLEAILVASQTAKWEESNG